MDFICSFTVQLALGIVPGFILLSANGISAALAICLSFPVSLSIYSVLGTTLGMLGIYGSLPVFVGTVLILLLVIITKFALNHFRNRHKCNLMKSDGTSLHEGSKRGTSVRLPPLPLLLSVGFALFIYFNTYYLTIGSMERFVQYDDNATHLAMIEAESRLGNYSTIQPGYNLPNDPYYICNTSYYPNGFHIIPALACSITGSNAAISENACAMLYTCLVFPLGITSLVYVCANKNSLAAAAAVPMALASVAFPLRMLTVHAPFPNIAGFSLVPVFCTAFILVFDLNESLWRVLLAPLVSIAISLAFVHPNALIFACVYIFPYFLFNYIPGLAKKIGEKSGIGRPILLRTVLQLLFIMFACVLWILVNQASFMHGIVTSIWEWSESLPSVLKDIVSGGLLLSRPQYAFGLLAFIGAAICLLHKRIAWLSISFFLISIIYIGTATGNDAVKSLLAGFWYTDPERLAAMVAIAMIPLASFGIYYSALTGKAIVFKLFSKLIGGQHRFEGRAIEVSFLVFCRRLLHEQLSSPCR